MTELLPCPFECEETAPELITECKGDLWYAWIKCPICDATMVGIGDPWGDDPRQSAIDMAVRQWNTRYERMCKNLQREEWGEEYDDDDGFVCSECLAEYIYKEPYYCPGCGAKVVD